MKLSIGKWSKILLVAAFFTASILGFMVKLPSSLRHIDKELHSLFYFCAAAFLNLLFADKKIARHLLIFGILFLFGVSIEYAQEFSNTFLHSKIHGRYDIEDIQSNLKGLLAFSGLWLAYVVIYFGYKKITVKQMANCGEATNNLSMDIQSIYQQAIKFAASKHAEKNQTIPSTNLPYVVHLSNVAMEILLASQYGDDFKLDFAIRLALPHDVLEDTSATFEELSQQFGLDVAQGVLALTKNNTLPKAEKMLDSLSRIKELQKEVWAVKMADRITNLQEPPAHWDGLKKASYREEAIQILEHLKAENMYLEQRLGSKIDEYEKYI